MCYNWLVMKKVYAQNKKASFEYEIIDTFEAGLVLEGHEVKSIRTGHINLKGGFVTFHREEPMLINVHISKYKHAGNLENYDPERSRKLLLKKKQILFLRGKLQEKGLTVVPLSVYNSGSKIKIEIGIGRGKKKYDKRRAIKERDLKVHMRKALKGDM